MAKLTFLGGIHPYDGKELSKDKPIQDILPRKELVYPLSQHIGAPAKPIVKKGDRVLTGQKIAESGGFVSASIYASVSGVVKSIEPRRVVTGDMIMSIVLENDELYEDVGFYPSAPLEKLSREEIIDIIREAGIVGMGGAGFPTHVKINCKAEFVLANGAECEPLLRVDQQVMQYFAADVVRGIRAVKEFTGAKRAVICLKEHYHAAVAALQEVLKDADDVELHLLQGYYPAGDEQQIVYEVTGRVVPTGGLPLDVGAVVCNVSTLTNIAAALDGKKVTEKYVTVGGAVKNPVTLRVPVGISLQELMDAAGGPTCDCKYIIGGPCMGRVVDTLDIPVTKTTGGLLAIPKDHPLLERKSPKLNLQLIMSVCCQCSMCTQMCPRNALGLNVQPHKAMRSLASGGDLLGEFNGIFSCCNCGLCTYYACNFGLKPSQVMQTLKSAIASKGVRPRKEVYGPVDGGLENKKVPVERLIARLGIAEYDVPAPMAEKPLTTSCVRIALRMGVGAPSVPVVAVGDKVRKNQLVADIAEKKLGVKMHASISGVVTDITADYIEIRKAAK